MAINKTNSIELLAPAKNLEVGMAAIAYGADAVYIGAPKFGARAAAGNSIDEIKELVAYAHRYYARVYVTLNTILSDEELVEVEALIHELYAIGVDALIVQDMGILELDLPPIALHASTQCDNRSVEKVQFLEHAGFDQIVLARELSLKQIQDICNQSNSLIECFVHGALCVCYSGQCYMSQARNARSANRGNCAQLCRMSYDLKDNDGNVLLKDKHVLSLKDFDASEYLREMIQAGVYSFKIEGRLKDADYVKNITAYYRELLDRLIGEMGLSASSSGKMSYQFTPNPKKSFYRGSTSYFLADRDKEMFSFDTPKSMGEPVGAVRDVWRNAFSMDSHVVFENGDGLCGLNKRGEFIGFRVNKVEDGRLFPYKPVELYKGMQLYRNADVAFEKLLAGKAAERKVLVSIIMSETTNGFELKMIDDMAHEAEVKVEYSKEESKQPERMKQQLESQLAKLGDSIYKLESLELNLSDYWFIPVSVLNGWRRDLVEEMDKIRAVSYHVATTEHNKSSHPYFKDSIDYRGNVSNSKAEQFYREHGVETISRAFELKSEDGAELMRTKYCLRNALKQCPKENKTIGKATDWILEQKEWKYKVCFD